MIKLRFIFAFYTDDHIVSDIKKEELICKRKTISHVFFRSGCIKEERLLAWDVSKSFVSSESVRIYSTRFEKAAIIEPSCSLNELIRLPSVHHQSEKIDAIIHHHEMLQSLTHSAAAAAAPETRAAPNVPYISLPIYLPAGSVRPLRLSFHLPVLSYTDDMTSSSGREKSISCQLRGRAGISCDSANVTLSPSVNHVIADVATSHSDNSTAVNCYTAETGRFVIKHTGYC